MGAQAESLAAAFERENDDLIAFVEACPTNGWLAHCAAEDWTVAATVHHIATSHALIADWARAIATGQPAHGTRADLNERNAREAQEYSSCDQAATIDLLRREGAAAARVVRGLADEQLDRRGQVFADAPPESGRSVCEIVERILIGHIASHLPSIRAAVGTTTQSG